MRIPPVSIPQSGFGAFEQSGNGPRHSRGAGFQSLSRDSGRLNQMRGSAGLVFQAPVSIPQSGFGAFEPLSGTREKA